MTDTVGSPVRTLRGLFLWQALRLHAACDTRLKAAELQITELGRRGVTGAEPEG